ncbi:hypothetical protein GFY24_32860 [Nocardia sp. SYP-A9097]|uniref:flavoprotein n=1 Tax=Nocardia sp. SYP-A9097 TaxID=2663237 RepID=UPI00129BBD8A|nr:flavoprotein [Nocardia sp. SYP-A9097]MRH92174.1 hypothetical protein [Nocardia sp. SYP-A9097]
MRPVGLGGGLVHGVDRRKALPVGLPGILLPPADALIVAPMTCNSAAKWAAGDSDTLPLGILVEAAGSRKPVVAVPYSNDAQLSFPRSRMPSRTRPVTAAADSPGR